MGDGAGILASIPVTIVFLFLFVWVAGIGEPVWLKKRKTRTASYRYDPQEEIIQRAADEVDRRRRDRGDPFS
jgi:hypothetical protein